MRNSIWKKRLASAAMAACMLIAMPCGGIAKTVDELKAEQQQLEQENQELQSKLEDLKEDEAQKEAYQETLSEKIDVVKTQIDTTRKNIEELDASITELTQQIQDSQKEIENTLELFKQRLKALYTAGNVGTLEILLDSTSFTDFNMRSQAIQSMSEKDQKLMDELTDFMEKTQDKREECEAKKKEVAEEKKTLESKQEELAGLYDENAAALAENQNTQSEMEATIAQNEEQGAAKIAEIEQLIAAQKAAEEEALRQQQAAQQNGSSGDGGSSGTIGDGEFDYPTGGGGVDGFNPIWPLPGVSYVSCYYGGYAGHRGMDIAGPYGTPIVAAESGTVIEANNYDSWGDSWGYYVLIYHNGTYTTRYAHMSSMVVSTGQAVQQGQLIGYEGDTGNVTGPHLHFEVYENGSRVDPMNFL